MAWSEEEQSSVTVKTCSDTVWFLFYFKELYFIQNVQCRNNCRIYSLVSKHKIRQNKISQNENTGMLELCCWAQLSMLNTALNRKEPFQQTSHFISNIKNQQKHVVFQSTTFCTCTFSVKTCKPCDFSFFFSFLFKEKATWTSEMLGRNETVLT